MTLSDFLLMLKGGSGSGNWGHAGRPGNVGGSSPHSVAMSLRTARDWKQRQIEKKKLSLDPELKNNDNKKAMNAYLRNQNTNIYNGVPKFSLNDIKQQKHEVAKNLSEKTNLPYDAVNRTIRQWADTSNDNNMNSLSIQETAAELFGTKLSQWQKEQIKYTKSHPLTIKKVMLEGRNINPYDSPKSAVKAILSSMYEETQNDFKKNGIKTITLYRGTSAYNLPGVKGEQFPIEQNALESWSTEINMAKQFGHTVMKTEVPVERILSNARTGFGCLDEWEYVVIGGQNDFAEIVQ